MAVFENTSVLLDLKNLSYKEKKKLKSAVTDNGGSVSFVVNEQCTLVVTSDVSSLSSNRLRSIHKHQTPVVGVDYIYTCLHRGGLLPVEEFKLVTSPPVASSPPLPLSSLRPAPLSHHVPVITAAVERPRGKSKPVSLTPSAVSPERSANVLDKFRIYTETDSDLPSYPNDFQVAKYSIFEKINSNTWCVLELQSFKGRQYRVVRCWRNDVEVKKELVFLSTSEDAVDVYQALRETWQAAGLQPRRSIPPQSRGLGSFPLQQLLLEEKLNTGSVSQEVAVFVELLWTEALGRLSVLLLPSIDKISLNDVSRAEGLLLQAQRKLKEGNYSEMSPLMQEFSTLLPNRLPPLLLNAKDVSQKLDFCQLIRDVLSVSEMSLRGPAPSSLGKYRALRCSVETVPPGSSEFQAVTSVLRDSKLQILQILRVGRGVELETFKNELGNVNMLLHSSSPCNFVGILSRGLLLPHTGVEHHGIERTDVGNLGSGIYFSDAVSTALKYSRPSEADGSRLLLVCDVALGRCRDVYKRDVTLTQAPEGHHSVHGVRCTPDTHSEFEDDEYVVYSPDQVKLKYVVQFSIEGEALREFSPAVDSSAEPCPPPSLQVLSSEDVGVEDITNPLDEVKAGLLDSSGQQLPLQAVHVKCKLMDLLSQVIIFQKYTNTSSVSIEAKYVFPLDDSAAVCGFEAFINGKHVVGKVKEKETARKEYKQAIEKGHGAYLMDQDAPDVFTISVGNLPPGATVLIKVTFVSELIIRDGSILFSLPGSVAPWQESAALNQTTQVTVEKVCVTDDAANTREFGLDVSVEMPNSIICLKCITHKVKVKRTDCKAVVSVLPGQVMGLEGFQLSFSLLKVHLPRMWVERHPDKDSQACMLVFYPDFEVSSRSESDEVVLLLDTSESMKGESLRMAQRIALQVLKALGSNVRLNVVLFGTDHTEAFLTAQPLTEARQAAESFIKNLSPVGGSTELWRPLRALSLLPPSRGIRNLLLLSDGHIQNADFTLKLLRDDVQHSRLFTCGLSPTANRHMLRALAQAGGGAYEFFDTKVKHNWSEKVSRQVKRVESPGCSSVSVKWQQFNPTAPSPVQAPKQLHALFNDCHTLVYGFVPHCTQATLHGNLSGQELNTMVSTSELQKTRGTFLHKLTARALIRDYEDGSLDTDEAEHEGKKAELKSFIIELSKEFSILSQFTSFVAIEERDPEEPEEGFTDIPKLIAEEDVDFLPYISWDVSHDMLEYCDQERPMRRGGVTRDSTSPQHSTDSSSSFCSTADGMREIHIEQDEDILDLACESDSALSYDDLSYVPCSLFAQSQTSLIPPTPPPVPASAPDLFIHMQSSSSSQGSIEDSSIPLRSRPSLLSCLGSCSLRRGSIEDSLIPPPPPPAPAPTSAPTPPPARAPTSAPTSSSRRQNASLTRSSIQTSLIPPPPPPPPAPAPAPAPPPPPPPALDPAPAPAPPPPPAPARALAPPPPPALTPPPATATAPPPAPSFRRQTSSSTQGSMEHSLFSLRPSLCSFKRRSIEHSPIMMEPKCLTKKRSLCYDKFASDCSKPSHSISLASGASGWSPVFNMSHLKSSQETESLLTETESSDHIVALEQAEPLSEMAHGSACSSEVRAGGRVIRQSLGSVPDRLFQIKPVESARLSGRRSGRIRRELYRSCSPTGGATVRSQKLLILGGETDMEPGYMGSQLCVQGMLTDPDPMMSRWAKIFQMQHSEGYWELTTELYQYMNVNIDRFVNVFLKNKGICSLGERAHTDILRLVATLLVLQMMREEKLEEGKLLRTLFCLDDSAQPRPQRWEEVKKAVEWVRWADTQYPCIYSRLEFGLSWESSTRQLLGYEGLPPFSPLRGQISPLLVR